MTTSLQLKMRLQPQQALDDLQADLQSEEGQRQTAEDALATANADLQFANDNLFAAQVRLQPSSRRWMICKLTCNQKKVNAKLQKTL